VVALSSLGYNTWRNERTEQNRNIRSAGFELLMKPGELQELVFLAHYDRDTERGNPRGGWAYVLTVRDPGKNMPAPGPGKRRDTFRHLAAKLGRARHGER
jgi:hypothetical protein